MKKWSKIERAFTYYHKAYRQDMYNDELFWKAVELCNLLTDHIAGRLPDFKDAEQKASNIWRMYYASEAQTKAMHDWVSELCLEQCKRKVAIRDQVYEQLWNRDKA